MGMFRKKPVVIEARRLAPDVADELAEWCNGDVFGYGSVLIRTLEGDMAASCGDWIILGVNGEFYPCKADIFAKTYEPA